MQIELIGCSCAGKSTLARQMVLAGRQLGHDIVLADEFVLRELRLGWLQAVTLRKAAVNIAGVLAALFTWRRNGTLYRFGWGILKRLPRSRFERASLARNVLKKIGLAEFVKARARTSPIVVMDEGALHIAHNLFVHESADVNSDGIPVFTRLVQMPDVVVYVRTPEDIVVERMIQRGHRRISDASHESVAAFVRRAMETFDRLVEDAAVAERLVTTGEADRRVLNAYVAINAPLALATRLIEPYEHEHAA